LLNAKIETREDGFTRYDAIRFSEVGDRFDPFQITSTNPAKNSYIGEPSWLGGGLQSKKSFHNIGSAGR
jgi:hypothetical protein